MATEGHLQENSILLETVGLFTLLRPLVIWQKLTFIMEGDLPYSKVTDLNVSFIPSHHKADTRNIE